MVQGLFPRDEHRMVISMLERSVVFLTRENIETILLQESFDGTAWMLANLYLAGIGAELLSEDAPGLDGLSQDTTCYVSPQYFQEGDRFADFIVHEAAHVFHNCKRSSLGLNETRSKVWLLDIEYRKRETSTGSGKRSRIHAKPTRAYSNWGSARQTDRPSLTSSAGP